MFFTGTLAQGKGPDGTCITSYCKHMDTAVNGMERHSKPSEFMYSALQSVEHSTDPRRQGNDGSTETAAFLCYRSAADPAILFKAA